jgi:hypothetical protein
VLGALVYAGLPGGGAPGRLDPDGAAAFVRGLHHALWTSAAALLAVAAVAGVLCARDRPAGEPPARERAAGEGSRIGG